MARYDRIARIPPPEREHAFPSWFTLRDLEGREREPELGRRARLRYLALRPLRRMLARGLASGDGSPSLDLQVDAVRQELSQLPARDPERNRIARYLREIGGRSPTGLVRAALDVGQAAEASGHRYAAEEFFLSALELAAAHELTELRILALRLLGRVYRDREEWDAAERVLRSALDLAEEAGDDRAWAEAMDGMARTRLRQDRPDEARRILAEIDPGSPSVDPSVRAIGRAGLCELELAAGNEEQALVNGWEALSLLDTDEERRNGVLLSMAAAFRRQGLHDAADSCYDLVIRWSAWPEHRAEARMERAVTAAEAGDADGYLENRRRLLRSLDRSDRQLTALLNLGLGRGALMVGQEPLAREHLREAISTARDLDAAGVLERAEALLSALEDGSADRAGAAAPPSETSRRVAGQLARFAEEGVAAEP